MLGENFVVFYQLKPEENRLMKGETKYAILATRTVKMEDKLKEFMPSNMASLEMDNIEEKADMAKKMGLTGK